MTGIDVWPVFMRRFLSMDRRQQGDGYATPILPREWIVSSNLTNNFCEMP